MFELLLILCVILVVCGAYRIVDVYRIYKDDRDKHDV
jgi:Sec-independent protein translocase protein TatA